MYCNRHNSLFRKHLLWCCLLHASRAACGGLKGAGCYRALLLCVRRTLLSLLQSQQLALNQVVLVPGNGLTYIVLLPTCLRPAVYVRAMAWGATACGCVPVCNQQRLEGLEQKVLVGGD